MLALGGTWRETARERFEKLLEEMQSDVSAELKERHNEVTQRAAERFAGELNQTLRRMRQTHTVGEVVALLSEAGSAFAERSAVFLFLDGRAVAEVTRGLGDEPIEFAPQEAHAFRAVVESRDPVVAMSAASEISEALSGRVGAEGRERAHLFPVVVRGAVNAVFFALGEVHAAPLEVLAGIAGLQLEGLTAAPVVKREDLVAITGAADPAGARASKSWTDLSATDHALHLKAQKTARVMVANMRLDHADELRAGQASGDLYGAMREVIDAARGEFRQRFIGASPTMVDYLYLEILRGLANNDEKRLGEGFPEPLI